MNKPKLWKGKDLFGTWVVTIKVDGVRCLKKDGEALSRSDKKLYNIPKELPDGDYEVFDTDWNKTVSLVRTIHGTPIPLECFYSLDPVDERLILGKVADPTAEYIKKILKATVLGGNEGIVLRQCSTWLKVKPVETCDVVITGIQEGTKKYEGMLGAFITEKGKVGTGLTDAQREKYMDYSLIGETIEVSYFQLTDKGKFRHPRFKRLRWDK